MNSNRLHRIVAALIIIGLVLPPLIIGSFLVSIPSITPEQAAGLMNEFKNDVVLVDVRPEQEFQAFSLQASINVPLANAPLDIQSLKKRFEGKKYILVICDTGLSGAWETRRLRGIGFSNAVNVQGGLDAWLTGDPKALDKKARTSRGTTDGVIATVLPVSEQFIITMAAWVLKPLYQILSMVIAVMLWKRREPDFTALRRAVIAFFLGENACALNYLVFHEQSVLMEYWHTYGMLLCFGLVVYALMEAFDKRVFHFSERGKKCALLPLCGHCYKYSGVSCNLRLLFLFIIPVSAVVAAIPLTASLGSHFFTGNVFGYPVIFGHPVMYQVIETRFYPLVSLCFLTISFLALLLFRENGFEASKIFFAMALGPLGFSLMRFFCYWGYQQNPLWADAWEEITEFLFIAAILWLLLRVRAVSRQSAIGHSQQMD